LLPDIQALLKECTFYAVRSSGKGGQHVNKVSTKVILEFDVYNSVELTEEQKQWMIEKLFARISNEGLIQLNASSDRTQLGNRRLVEEKFERLITKVFHVPVTRIATRPTLGSKERRLQEKRSVSSKKSSRGSDFSVEITDE
jgi:ribosome-associated protein